MGGHLFKISKKLLVYVFLPFIIFGIFLLGIFYLKEMFKIKIFNDTKNILSYEAREIDEKINNKIETYSVFLYSLRGYLDSLEQVSPLELHEYLKDTKLTNTNTDIKSVVLVKVIKNKDREILEKEMKEYAVGENNYKNFKIFPKTDLEDSWVITHAHSEKMKYNLFGYDLKQDIYRNSFLQKSIDENSTIITDKINLLEDNSSGFEIYLPVFKQGYDLSIVEERNNALDGFVILTINSDFFYRNIFSRFGESQFLRFRIYQYLDSSNKKLVFDGGSQKIDLSSKLTVKKDYSFNSKNKKYLISIYSPIGFGGNKISKLFIDLFFWGGLFFSFLTSLIFYALIFNLYLSNKKREEIKKKIEESESVFKEIFDNSIYGIFIQDLEGNFLNVNKVACEMIGCIVNVSPDCNNKILKKSVLSKTISHIILKLRSNNIYSFETTQVDKNKKRIPVRIISRFIKYREKTAVLSYMENLRYEKRKEDQLLKKIKEIEKLNNMMLGREVKILELKRLVYSLKNKQK